MRFIQVRDLLNACKHPSLSKNRLMEFGDIFFNLCFCQNLGFSRAGFATIRTKTAEKYWPFFKMLPTQQPSCNSLLLRKTMTTMLELRLPERRTSSQCSVRWCSSLYTAHQVSWPSSPWPSPLQRFCTKLEFVMRAELAPGCDRGDTVHVIL